MKEDFVSQGDSRRKIWVPLPIPVQVM